jgi:5-methylcytosine-specific restriction endonuclease McrA
MTKDICKIHGETEYKNQSGTPRCLKCRNLAVSKRRKKLKQLAIEYKGGKCSVCGYDRYIGALNFHHQNPKEKDFGLSARGFTHSWEKTKIELDKCILICSNCHAELHDKLRNSNPL